MLGERDGEDTGGLEGLESGPERPGLAGLTRAQAGLAGKSRPGVSPKACTRRWRPSNFPFTISD